jgi:hypothetical protein
METVMLTVNSEDALTAEMQARTRQVCPLFRVHVTDARAKQATDLHGRDSCIVTVWTCSDDVRSVLTEGHRIRLFQLEGATRANWSFNFRRSSRMEAVSKAHPGFIPRKRINFGHLEACAVGQQLDFSAVLITLSVPATLRAREHERVYLVDHTLQCKQRCLLCTLILLIGYEYPGSLAVHI